MTDLTLDDRITISSMATEMGAVIILFPPSKEIIDYCSKHAGKEFQVLSMPMRMQIISRHSILMLTQFRPMVSRPGEPHDTVDISEVQGTKIDSAFIGSCTNGRMSDMRKAAAILKGQEGCSGCCPENCSGH